VVAIDDFVVAIDDPKTAIPRMARDFKLPTSIHCSNTARQALRFLALRAPPRRRPVKANTAKIVHEM
jgi:hypothetical protein